MRILIFIAALFAAVAVNAQQVNTSVFGSGAVTNVLVVSGKTCKLYNVSGYNNGATTVYLQISTNGPVNGSVPMFSYPVLAAQYTSYDFGWYGADISGSCTISYSTTLSTLTLAPNTTGNLNAVTRSN